MTIKLSALVSAALSDASMKIASGASVAQAEKTASLEGSKRASEDRSPVVTPTTEKKASVTDTAKEAIKLAESLEHLAMIFPKMASIGSSTMHVSGPEILEPPNKGLMKHTKTQASSLTSTEASTGGGPLNAKGQVPNDGSVGGVPNRFSKKAAEEMLLAKIAQSEALILVGQATEAAKLANAAKAEFELAKKAYEEEDASTRTPKGNPKTLETFQSGNGGVAGGVAPDNKGVASFTKRDGKKREIAPIAEHVREPAFSARSDRGIQDNFEHTQGAKIAASMLDNIVARKSGRSAA